MRLTSAVRWSIVVMPRDIHRGDVPRGALTIRPTTRDRARLEALQRLLDTSQTEVVRRALIHTLATLERGEPLHVSVPSEQAGPKGSGQGKGEPQP